MEMVKRLFGDKFALIYRALHNVRKKKIDIVVATN